MGLEMTRRDYLNQPLNIASGDLISEKDASNMTMRHGYATLDSNMGNLMRNKNSVFKKRMRSLDPTASNLNQLATLVDQDSGSGLHHFGTHRNSQAFSTTNRSRKTLGVKDFFSGSQRFEQMLTDPQNSTF